MIGLPVEAESVLEDDWSGVLDELEKRPDKEQMPLVAPSIMRSLSTSSHSLIIQLE